ncbi:MAG: monovalent cation/H(+) antiporter subunit G [Thiogranum sp.]
MIEVMSSLLTVSGLGFYLAGSIGLLHLPDLYSRLHALTKTDNLGLGLLTAGMALYTQDLLIAQHARRRETQS